MTSTASNFLRSTSPTLGESASPKADLPSQRSLERKKGQENSNATALVTTYIEGRDRSTHVYLPRRETVVGHWEGRVVDRSENSFTALLVDILLGTASETIEGEFPLAEVSVADLELIQPNALFRWIVGKSYSGSTLTRFNRIQFRRLPGWNRRDLATARAEALDLVSNLVWD